MKKQKNTSNKTKDHGPKRSATSKPGSSSRCPPPSTSRTLHDSVMGVTHSSSIHPSNYQQIAKDVADTTLDPSENIHGNTRTASPSPPPSPIPQRRRPRALISAPSSHSHSKPALTRCERSSSPESIGSPIPARRPTLQRSPSDLIPEISLPSSTSSSSCGSPIPSRSVNNKSARSTDDGLPSSNSKKVKLSSATTHVQSPPQSTLMGLSSPSTDPHDPSSPTAPNLNIKPSSGLVKDDQLTKLRPVRVQRPIKNKVAGHPKGQLTCGPEKSGPPLDEDDFFNLSSLKPIQFVSKTLGLSQPPTEPNASTSKSPTPRNSIVPNFHTQILVDLDNDLSDDEETSDGTDSDELETGNKSKSKRTFRNLPNWTRAAKIDDVDSFSDDGKEGTKDLENTGGQNLTRKTKSKKLNKKSRKKRRPAPPPKSRSPTPPPMRSQAMIQSVVKKLCRGVTQADSASIQHKQTLEALRRAEEFELMKVLNDVDVSKIPTNFCDSNNTRYHQNQDDQANEVGCSVTFHASMVLDPRILGSMSKEARDHYERPILLQMKSNQKFDLVYRKFHELFGIPIHGLVVSYDNIKLSPFVTPESISIFSHANLRVYASATWDYVTSLRRQKIRLSSVPRGDPPDPPTRQSDQATQSSRPISEDIVSPEFQDGSDSNTNHPQIDPSSTALDQPTANYGQELINITVRKKDKSRVDLLVKPHTTIKSIVKNFLIESNYYDRNVKVLDDEAQLLKKFQIRFDGQNLNFSSTIQDNDICDEDVLDFIFL